MPMVVGCIMVASCCVLLLGVRLQSDPMLAPEEQS